MFAGASCARLSQRMHSHKCLAASPDVAGSGQTRRRALVVRASYSRSETQDGYKVLVAGATGGTGKAVVDVLRAKGISVRALVRDPAKATTTGTPTSGKRGWERGGRGSNTTPTPLAGLDEGLTQVFRGDVTVFPSLPPALEGCSAVVCCTGASNPTDPLGPFNVDYQGTLNLIAAAKQCSVKQFVLVTSIGADELANPLNLFWGVLFWKKRAEEELQRSGLSYTIVRPGGLKSSLAPGETAGSIVMAPPGTYGLAPGKKAGAILRSQVAEVCVAALSEPAAANKVVEVIAERGARAATLGELFAGVNWY